MISSKQLEKARALAYFAEKFINQLDHKKYRQFDHIHVSADIECMHFSAHRFIYEVHENIYYCESSFKTISLKDTEKLIKWVYDRLIDSMLIREAGITPAETNNPILLPESVFKEIMNEIKIGENI